MFYIPTVGKKSKDPTSLVSGFVTGWAARERRGGAHRGAFVLDGTPLADADMGDELTLLPLVMWHADNLYKYSLNKSGLGLAFHTDPEALLRHTVSLDSINQHVSEVLVYTLEALEDSRQNLPKSELVVGAVELRSLVNQFAAAFDVSLDSVSTIALTGSSVKHQV